MNPSNLERSFAPIAIASKVCFCAPFTRDQDGKWKTSVPLAVFGFILQLSAVISTICHMGQKLMNVKGPIMNDPFLLLSTAHMAVNLMQRILFTFNSAYSHARVTECMNLAANLAHRIPLGRKFYRKATVLSTIEVVCMLPIPFGVATTHVLYGDSVPTSMLDAISAAIVSLQEVHSVNFFILARAFADKLHNRMQQLDQRAKKTNFGGTGMSRNPMLKVIDWRTSADEIAEIHQLYREVWQMKAKFNETFSLQLYATITHTFIQMIYYSFLNSIINMDIDVSAQALSPLRMIMIKVWTIFVVMKIFWMVCLCHVVAETFKRTGPILLKAGDQVTDPAAKLEIRGFSAELLHLNPNITAYGLFDVNSSLLLSMGAALFMYFLILIQADLVSKYQGTSALKQLSYFGS